MAARVQGLDQSGLDGTAEGREVKGAYRGSVNDGVCPNPDQDYAVPFFSLSIFWPNNRPNVSAGVTMEPFV